MSASKHPARLSATREGRTARRADGGEPDSTLEGTSVRSLPPTGDAGLTDRTPTLPGCGAPSTVTDASREPAVAAAAAQAPPGCTCGGRSICLHCFFAEADTLEQKMMAAALEATERALARERVAR